MLLLQSAGKWCERYWIKIVIQSSCWSKNSWMYRCYSLIRFLHQTQWYMPIFDRYWKIAWRQPQTMIFKQSKIPCRRMRSHSRGERFLDYGTNSTIREQGSQLKKKAYDQAILTVRERANQGAFVRVLIFPLRLYTIFVLRGSNCAQCKILKDVEGWKH